MLKNTISGAIYGQFIGDALGSRYEFGSNIITKQKIINDMSLHGSNLLYMLGEGPYNLIPGQVTDDTELAMGLLYSILENNKFDKEQVAKKYIKWYKSNPFDIGQTTTHALANATNYSDIVNNSKQYNKTSLSNGCLMRISPLAIYGLKLSDKLLLQYCYEDTIMTNPNLITIDAVGVYCIAIKTALVTNDKTIIFKKAFAVAKTDKIKTILINSLGDPNPVLESKYIGYVGIALQNAFYELMNGVSFYDSIINIIARGGDTDTNGCIAGALLGAYYGIDGIPKHWISGVKIHNPRSKIYYEVDQTNIQSQIDKLYNLIINTQ